MNLSKKKKILSDSAVLITKEAKKPSILSVKDPEKGLVRMLGKI